MRFMTHSAVSLLSGLAVTRTVAGAFIPDVNVRSSGSEPEGYKSTGTHGAVVSEVAVCSEAGLEILQRNGTAADAIIATSLCVGVIAAYHSGVGGGGFMLYRSQNGYKNHTYEMIDFRETMPALGNETMYSNNSNSEASLVGGLAVGVPGEMRGWQMLHEKYGKLPWASLFQPAIKLARDGFEVNVDLAYQLDESEYPFLVSDPLWAETYAPNGSIATQNQTLYRKRYANTLETLSRQGADAFYSGPIAENTVAAAQAANGILQLSDLANYTAISRAPCNITYRDQYRIFSTVAPSSGSVTLSALKIFEGYPGSALDDDPAINLTTHRIIEGTKFAYGQRTTLGDPAFTANVTYLEQLYLQEDVAAAARAQISDNTTYPVAYYDPEDYISLDDHGTSHMAAVDQYGNAVSLTTTVNYYWGSQVMTEDGIVLNDEMDDFSSPGETNVFGFSSSPINYIQPGKRPQSSIASSIAEDLETGEIVMATGSAGGSRIITATLQNLHHHLDQNMTAHQSVHESRWHDQLSGTTYFEYANPSVGIAGFSNATVAYLSAMGYNITYEDETGSTSHVIVKKDGVFEAANDPRKAAGGGFAY